MKHTDQVNPKMFEDEHNQDDVYFDLIQLNVLTISLYLHQFLIEPI